MKDPIKIIHKFKNNNRKIQYKVYIFIGPIVPDEILNILETIKDTDLYTTFINLSKKNYNKLEGYYGEFWYYHFFINYHMQEQINNINNTGKLNEYVSNEITKLINGLKEVGSKITDKVTQIKLAETIANVRKVKSVKKIKEQHLSALMMTYELLSELKQSIKK